MDKLKSQQNSIILHPIVSILVILFFLWLGFVHTQLYIETANVENLLFIVVASLVIFNRILWLPRIREKVDSNESFMKFRAFMPLLVIIFIVAMYAL